MQGISMRNCRDYEGRNAVLMRSTPGLKTLGILLVDASDETLHPALEEGRVDGHFRRVEWVLHHCVRVCLSRQLCMFRFWYSIGNNSQEIPTDFVYPS